MSIIAPTILDLMEYANDAAAQAAFVSNASAGYGPDILTGGTPSGYDTDGVPAQGCDNNIATNWFSQGVTLPHWWKYDSGAGIAKTVRKLRIYTVNARGGNAGLKDFKLQGSNNDSTWTDILSTTAANLIDQWLEWTFANAGSYRYHRIYISNSYSVNNYETAFYEVEMLELLLPSLQDYSEATIKQEGLYALKGVALITDSNGKTLTRTVSPTINLTDKTIIKFDIRASRTGSNIKIGIHDSGGTTTEITPVIATADTWQTVVWDISAVTNANKDAIDSIIVTIVNADAANTFYIDNMFGDMINNYLIHRGRDRFRSAGYSLGN